MKTQIGKKFFTLSFDDGTIHDIRFVQILNRYQLKCTFNLNSGLFGLQHRLVQGKMDVDHSEITADRVHDIYEGHEVACHSRTHPLLTVLEREAIIEEIVTDKKALEALCGYPVKGMAYPGGPYDLRVAQILKEDCGLLYGRTVASHHTFQMPENLMTWHPTCSHMDDTVFSLAESFLQAKPREQDLLFYVWGHSYELEAFQTWDIFEKLCALISGKNDIIYATNGEIAEYIHQQSQPM